MSSKADDGRVAARRAGKRVGPAPVAVSTRNRFQELAGLNDLPQEPPDPWPDKPDDDWHTPVAARGEAQHEELGAVTADSAPLLRAMGTLAGSPVTFMVDSGATSNFVDAGLVRRLGLKLQPVNRTVRLADGSTVVAGGALTAACGLQSKQGLFRFTDSFLATPMLLRPCTNSHIPNIP